MNIKERIDYLRREIERHRRLYYENDAPAISDFEFDALFEELKELEAANKDREFIEKKLSNESFVSKAPANVVDQQRQNLQKVLEKIKNLNDSIAEMEKLK